uniref:oxaloacetate tautomerase n=1 Tax=Biomphalaria glabrata TaxID=6526 RepID=A0A2C9JCM4_BIOGL
FDREHAAELGNPVPSKPILFLKPTSAYISEGQAIKIPQGCNDLNHEVELGVVIGSKAIQVAPEEALNYVGGYALGLDMTARDWQSEAKKQGHPWSLAKGFDTSCPVSAFIEKEKYFTLEPGDLLLTGTPSGVSKLKPGDIIQAGLGNLISMQFKVDK